MAIKVDDATHERTFRVEIFSEKGNVPVVRAHREFHSASADGKFVMSNREVPHVTRLFSDFADKPMTFQGVTMTGTQLAAFIADAVDAWSVEDKAARQAAAEKAAADKAAADKAAADAVELRGKMEAALADRAANRAAATNAKA